MSGLAGKVVAITGASRGIGAEAARAFAAAGAKVALLARSADAIAALAGEVGGLAVACDVADAGAVAAAVAKIETDLGPIDILINNAGMIEPIARITDASPEEWGRDIDVNLKGVFHGMHAVLPGMIGRRSGTIITVSSGAAHNPLEGWSAYCTSKAGAAMLTRVAHLEAAGSGVRIMGLSPGTVATEMQVKIKASGINPVSQLDPSVHIPADWPARALVWMCSADADDFLGMEVQLRDDKVRRRVGLIA
ncbi:MAG: SDR family NAD(P)-dependent oxidoreductase [Paracoccaceae bacterium]|nr:SDR family NAD(P)-dependent oxidoreductase [Paracoccaceae bacterium]MDE3123439.1 SDR family NAD(P)-dependent oxidoreductase [Paracoccaceae bacterium]MDE3237903.1 SDR family NAD(P)-dependent oxidoreductase [Paracoccaceae bacterium]